MISLERAVLELQKLLWSRDKPPVTMTSEQFDALQAVLDERGRIQQIVNDNDED